MVTIEVNLKEGDKPPEQHLDEGEHIERVTVPLSELYEKLQGKHASAVFVSEICQPVQPSQRSQARSWTPGEYHLT